MLFLSSKGYPSNPRAGAQNVHSEVTDWWTDQGRKGKRVGGWSRSQ
jgi:hypothetical protein